MVFFSGHHWSVTLHCSTGVQKKSTLLCAQTSTMLFWLDAVSWLRYRVWKRTSELYRENASKGQSSLFAV